jgi:hypothetical protein
MQHFPGLNGMEIVDTAGDILMHLSKNHEEIENMIFSMTFSEAVHWIYTEVHCPGYLTACCLRSRRVQRDMMDDHGMDRDSDDRLKAGVMSMKELHDLIFLITDRIDSTLLYQEARDSSPEPHSHPSVN